MELGPPDYTSERPSLSSNLQLLDLKTEVYVCENCGLAQSPALDNATEFYGEQYRISLESDDHDQLITLPSGETLFRNDLQCRLLTESVALPTDAKILDFGGAKAASLKKICEGRADLVPYVFDVSGDYQSAWATWIPPGNTAIHAVPERWRGQIDVIIANFVLEHIAEPVETLTLLAKLLSTDGTLFLTVPNALLNTGDLLVVDHLNHFTPASIAKTFMTAGFSVETVDSSQFPGGLMVVAKKGDVADYEFGDDNESSSIKEALFNWAKIRKNLLAAAQDLGEVPVAIFGAGFYGNWIASVISNSTNIWCFLDNNPYLKDRSQKDWPVLAPSEMPANVEVIFAGINPMAARQALNREKFFVGKRLIFLE